MALRLIQFSDGRNDRGIAAFHDVDDVRRVIGFKSVYDLALAALRERKTLQDMISACSFEPVDLHVIEAEGRLLAPIDHPDLAHLYVSGTGLTHLGSAQGRDKMHREAVANDKPTDSMRMFLMGLEGGKPALGEPGAQPEWFYKGDGSILVGTQKELPSPPFALDAGEEPEIAGIYIIDDDGNPRRLGFCLANEFSDHVTERGNYLWLAHSKLRHAALGAELLTGDLPEDIRGTSSIRRGNEVVWEKPFLSGEANMSHSIANLEHHHFKYDLFRRPGDVHVHFFGTATLSFSDGFRAQEGDIFEVAAPPFQIALSNPLGKMQERAKFTECVPL